MRWLRFIPFVLIPLLGGCVTTTGGAYITPPESALGRLPPGIQLRPGELRIEFADGQEVLRRLLELSQAIMHDYAQFEALVQHTTAQ